MLFLACVAIMCAVTSERGDFMRNDVISYLDDHAEEALRLLMELAQIPAPSHQEERRAE